MIKCVVEVSARHIHLSQADFVKLFGPTAELSEKNKLSIKTDFATPYTVTLVNGDKKLEGVRVIGPFRPRTQIEISLTDARHMDVEPHIRLSGELSGTPGVTVSGDFGKTCLREGVIVAQRHLHIGMESANKLGLRAGMIVNLVVGGERGALLKNIMVRLATVDQPTVHVDTDEANAIGLPAGGSGEILIK
ncbi:MAG: PduL/EutD family phosphate acyltransferase [Candidatus Komeilibacteria bacterium]|nr:PduL/EutD family phosphate acyltransferase [Candidatus Komeilibacteria bacterium]